MGESFRAATFEVTYTSAAGFPMEAGEQLHRFWTDPEELRITLDDRWPLAIEVIQAIRAEEYQVLYSDSIGDQVLAMLSEFERIQEPLHG